MDGGGGVGEGQTKRQIVGSLDMSSSLHQTKEMDPNTPLFCAADLKAAPQKRRARTPRVTEGFFFIIPDHRSLSGGKILRQKRGQQAHKTRDWAVLRPAPSAVCRSLSPPPLSLPRV